MKKILTSVLAFFVCFTISLCQEGGPPRAKQVRSAFIGGDVLHVIQEAALDLKEYAGGSGDIAAIRVCSKEALPVALTTATASPFIMLQYLEHYGFSRERILFLRAEDCLDNNPAIAATEFWAVPKGAAPPPSVESIKSSQAGLEIVRTGDTIKSGNDYQVALRQLIARLRAKPEAVGVVVGSYNEKPGPLLQENLNGARRALERSKLSADRYFVCLTAPSGRSEDPSELEPEYPDLFIVEVSNARDSVLRLDFGTVVNTQTHLKYQMPSANHAVVKSPNAIRRHQVAVTNGPQ
jgi:hypothetical protein